MSPAFAKGRGLSPAFAKGGGQKVNDDGRRTTDDDQRMITIVHFSLRLRCANNTSFNVLLAAMHSDCL